MLMWLYCLTSNNNRAKYGGVQEMKQSSGNVIITWHNGENINE